MGPLAFVLVGGLLYFQVDGKLFYMRRAFKGFFTENPLLLRDRVDMHLISHHSQLIQVHLYIISAVTQLDQVVF